MEERLGVVVVAREARLGFRDGSSDRGRSSWTVWRLEHSRPLKPAQISTGKSRDLSQACCRVVKAIKKTIPDAKKFGSIPSGTYCEGGPPRPPSSWHQRTNRLFSLLSRASSKRPRDRNDQRRRLLKMSSHSPPTMNPTRTAQLPPQSV